MEFLFYSEDNIGKVKNNSFAVKISGNYKKKLDLFTELATKLKFPEYFGNNWDALYDCLCDFHWIENNKIIILHEDLPQLSMSDLKIYFKCLTDASKSWQKDDRHILNIVFTIKNKSKIERILAEI